MAQQFCQARPDAVVLVVSVELCSLHLHFKDDLDTILANSLFADGAAAAIVSNKPTPSGRNCYQFRSFASAVLPEGASDMAWTLGDQGFDIVLTKYVPRIIGANIHQLVTQTLDRDHLSLSDITTWAVHPGGKSIVDKVEKSLELKSSQLESSREILRQYGNMSSVTILFVLKRILEQAATRKSDNVFAVAFGPGLVVESALLTVG
jgi:predicted naringenin-chalcone synthase